MWDLMVCSVKALVDFTRHLKSGPKSSKDTIPMTRMGQKRCLMRLDIHAARTALDSRPSLNEPGEDSDMNMNIIATKYWAEIGVEVEIKPPADNATWRAMRRSGEFEGLISGGGGRNGSAMLLLFHLSHSKGAYNYTGLIDAEFDALVDAAQAATTTEERERLGREADLRRTWLHPSIWFLKVPGYAVVQPWLVGYNGERDLGPMQRNGAMWARLWIDWELKEAMGK